MKISRFRFKEADSLSSYLTGYTNVSDLVGYYKFECDRIDEKNVSSIEVHTPGNDEIIFYFFEDLSSFIKMKVTTPTITIINGKIIPHNRIIECNCKDKIIEFGLDVEGSEGYKGGYIKIFSNEKDEIPEVNINFDYFYYLNN